MKRNTKHLWKMVERTRFFVSWFRAPVKSPEAQKNVLLQNELVQNELVRLQHIGSSVEDGGSMSYRL